MHDLRNLSELRAFGRPLLTSDAKMPGDAAQAQEAAQ